jgi:ribosomal protein S18 acetylase RimI-like enzyme
MRPLTPADEPGLHQLRLQALSLHPEAFGTSVEEERAEGSSRMIGAYPSLTLGAFADDALVGMGGLLVPARVKQRHRGNLFSLFVAPAWRGQGVGHALLHGLVDHARRVGLRYVTLSVTVGNLQARALYRAAGFLSVGMEPDGFLVNGVTHDEERMALRLIRTETVSSQE